VGALLDAVLLDYELNRRGSIATARARLRILREAVGSRRAVTFTTEDVQRLQVAWQREGLTAGTINRRCNLLRKAFRLAWRSAKLPRLLYVPRLKENAARAVHRREGCREDHEAPARVRARSVPLLAALWDSQGAARRYGTALR